MKKRHAWLAVSLLSLCTVLPMTAAAQATAAAVNDKLTSALTCRGDSLGILRALPARKAALAPLGVEVRKDGIEGEEEVINVLLQTPLRLQGATTSKVSMSFESPNPNFSALVFAEFQGDPQAVIRGLKLVKGDKIGGAVGEYVTRTAAKPGCPAHIGLTLLGKDRFLLGCGWCNGG